MCSESSCVLCIEQIFNFQLIDDIDQVFEYSNTKISIWISEFRINAFQYWIKQKSALRKCFLRFVISDDVSFCWEYSLNISVSRRTKLETDLNSSDRFRLFELKYNVQLHWQLTTGINCLRKSNDSAKMPQCTCHFCVHIQIYYHYYYIIPTIIVKHNCIVVSIHR